MAEATPSNTCCGTALPKKALTALPFFREQNAQGILSILARHDGTRAVLRTRLVLRPPGPECLRCPGDADAEGAYANQIGIEIADATLVQLRESRPRLSKF